MGIDASLTKFGLSIYGLESGRHQTMLFRPKFKGARRLQEIWDFVSLVISVVERDYPAEMYTMEDYAMGIRGGHVFSIGEGGGAVKLALVQRYGSHEPVAYPTLVSTTALKKFVLGKGVGKKNEILLGVYRKWNVDFGGEDDMADAYALARVGAALLSATNVDHKYEHEVVDALERNTEWVPT